VLYVDRGTEREHLVFLYRSLTEFEAGLHAFVATLFVGPFDDSEIVEILAGEGIKVRLYAWSLRRGKQISTELKPFTHAASAA
jgi:hypothetical protein